MAKRHDIPVTADVEGVLNDRSKALIRKAIRTDGLRFGIIERKPQIGNRKILVGNLM